MSEANRPYNHQRQNKKKENWFEKNQSYWSFGATVISAAALIVSILVMLDQRNFAKTQFAFAKEQFDSSNRISKVQMDLAKAQFDTSIVDRKKNEIESDIRNKRQDSINRVQFRINKAQLKLQEYFSQVQIESDRPVITFDSLEIRSYRDKYKLRVHLINNGRRPCLLQQMTLITCDDSLTKFSYDTADLNNSLVSQQRYEEEFFRRLTDSASVADARSGLIFFLKVKYTDIILNKDMNTSILVFFGLDEDSKKITFEKMDQPAMLEAFEKLRKTHDQASFFKVLSRYIHITIFD